MEMRGRYKGTIHSLAPLHPQGASPCS
ncbi:hypothetical protein FOXYSP1_17588 [Fusarium oxysporum f. sp. phaseoli]